MNSFEQSVDLHFPIITETSSTVGQKELCLSILFKTVDQWLSLRNVARLTCYGNGGDSLFFYVITMRWLKIEMYTWFKVDVLCFLQS
jgi:hypothetical protein